MRKRDYVRIYKGNNCEDIYWAAGWETYVQDYREGYCGALWGKQEYFLLSFQRYSGCGWVYPEEEIGWDSRSSAGEDFYNGMCGRDGCADQRKQEDHAECLPVSKAGYVSYLPEWCCFLYCYGIFQ